MSKELYIGVMSGTSIDGVDITFCEINNTKCTLLHAQEYPFPPELKEEVFDTMSSVTILRLIGALHIKLGQLFADSINSFLKEYNIDSTSVTAIGLHGQTLWHQPSEPFPFSMQLGCPNVVFAQTSIKVVSDFRSMDIANGGQGAPFSPAFHQFIFDTSKK